MPKFVSSKEKMNTYFNNRKVISIKHIETFFLDKHVLSINFEDYIENEINRSVYSKQRILSTIDFLICFFMAIKFLFGAFITDPNILLHSNY